MFSAFLRGGGRSAEPPPLLLAASMPNMAAGWPGPRDQAVCGPGAGLPLFFRLANSAAGSGVRRGARVRAHTAAPRDAQKRAVAGSPSA